MCIFCLVLNAGDLKMAKNMRGKRPCSICRKWFQPISQQKKRQRTCSPACRQELHRRQCEQWNRRNKSYFKSNYLADKISAIDERVQSRSPPVDQQERPDNFPAACLLPSRRTAPVLPMDIIVARLGTTAAVIIPYLIFQVTRHVRVGTSRSP